MLEAFGALMTLIQFIGSLFVVDGWSNFLKSLGITLMICIVILPMNVGCQPNTEPIERAMTQALQNVIAPAVQKAASELSTRTAQLQGQGSLINPGYTAKGFVNFGPGVSYQMSLNADGVSANVSGATQADAGQAGTVPPPAVREKRTEPSQ